MLKSKSKLSLVAVVLATGVTLLASCAGSASANSSDEPAMSKPVKTTRYDDRFNGQISEVKIKLSDGRAVTCLVTGVEPGAGIHCLEPTPR